MGMQCRFRQSSRAGVKLDTVDEIRIEKGARRDGSAFDHQGGEAAGSEGGQQVGNRTGFEHLDAGRLQGRLACGPSVAGIRVAGSITGDHDHRDIRRRSHQFRSKREVEPAVEDDAQRRAIFEPWQPYGQFGVVGRRRADPDQDRIRLGLSICTCPREMGPVMRTWPSPLRPIMPSAETASLRVT